MVPTKPRFRHRMPRKELNQQRTRRRRSIPARSRLRKRPRNSVKLSPPIARQTWLSSLLIRKQETKRMPSVGSRTRQPARSMLLSKRRSGRRRPKNVRRLLKLKRRRMKRSSVDASNLRKKPLARSRKPKKLPKRQRKTLTRGLPTPKRRLKRLPDRLLKPRKRQRRRQRGKLKQPEKPKRPARLLRKQREEK